MQWLLFLFAFVTVLHPHALAQCTLSNVQGILPKAAFTPHTITVTADCGAGAFASIDWGDQTGSSSGTSPLAVSHTFSSTVQPPYDVIVNQQSSSSLYVTFPSPTSPSATFAGEKPQVTAPVAVLPIPPGPPLPIAPITIHFECGSAIDSNGNFYPDASAPPLNITCNSIPTNLSFAFNQSQDVTVEVATSGLASTFGSVRFPTKEIYAAWAMTPIVFFLSARIRRRRARMGSLLGLCAMLCLSLSITSCGGGFSSPSGTQVTQAGQYQVNVISVVPTGFVQTTLIVPLTVSPTQ